MTTDLVLITPEQKQTATVALGFMAEEWAMFLEALESEVAVLVVDCEAKAAEAANRAKEAAEFFSKCEEWRKSAVGPMNEAVAMINGAVRPFTDRADAAKRQFKARIGVYQDKVAAEARIERQKSEAEAARILAEAKELEKVSPGLAKAKAQEAEQKIAEGKATEVATITNKTGPGFGSASGKVEWVWDVVDLTLVPREYLKIEADRTQLNAAAKRQGGPPEIPGIAWRQERKVRVY